jgi:arsenite methyltransferase
MLEVLRRWFRTKPPDLRATVRNRFALIATAPRWQKRRIGSAVARELGYDQEMLDALPASVTESFAGVGNPLSLGEVRQGETVLDLGSGAGLDSILAAGKVGPLGRVIGIDMTAEMVEKARGNVLALGLGNVEFRLAEVEALAVPDGAADVAICNGLFNLCPDKPKALAEVYRALAPGGRFHLADILLEDHVTPEEVARKGSWSD